MSVLGEPADWRAHAVAAVDEYGRAWIAQDAQRIARLFAADAVYVERPFDESGTFRGQEAIRRYWECQVLSHQTNIRFRQLPRDLLWDDAKMTALAKWEAAFDKRRPDHTTTPCHFLQVAIIRFTPTGQIESLEEYWHSTIKQRRQDMAGRPDVRQHPVAAPAAQAHPMPSALMAAATPCPATTRTCSHCGAVFPTRNQLFAHLRGESLGDGVSHCPALGGHRDVTAPSVSCKKQNKFALVLAYSAAAATKQASVRLQGIVMAAWAAFADDQHVQAQSRAISAASPTGDGIGAVGNVVAVYASQQATKRLLQRWERTSTADFSGRYGLSREAIEDLNAKIRHFISAQSEAGGVGEHDSRLEGSAAIIECINIVLCSRDFDANKCCERRRFEYVLPIVALLPQRCRAQRGAGFNDLPSDRSAPDADADSDVVAATVLEQGRWKYRVSAKLSARFDLRAWPATKASKTGFFIRRSDILRCDARLVLDGILFVHVARVEASSVGAEPHPERQLMCSGWIFDRAQGGGTGTCSASGDHVLLTELTEEGHSECTTVVGGPDTARCYDDPVAVARTMERLDAALLCFSKAKKGRFHNYLRPLAQGTAHSHEDDDRRTSVDSGCQAAAAGRLSQCRRLDHSHQYEPFATHDDDWMKCTGSISVVLSFTGRSLSADQVCRMVTVLIGCSTQELPHELVNRSLYREVVFTIPAAARSMVYWAEGGFTAYEGKHKICIRPSAPKSQLEATDEGTAMVQSDESVMLSSINRFYKTLRANALKQYYDDRARTPSAVMSYANGGLSPWDGREDCRLTTSSGGAVHNIYVQLRKEYEGLQAWPSPTMPHREDLHSATLHRPLTFRAGFDHTVTHRNVSSDRLSSGWYTISSQFEDVLALAGGEDVAALPTVAVGDPAWVGRVFVAHDHCLLIGGRLDGHCKHESTLVRLPRGGPVTPLGASVGVEICMETLAIKLSEVRWRQQREGPRPYVTLSASNSAFCIGSTGFPALVECIEQHDNGLVHQQVAQLKVPVTQGIEEDLEPDSAGGGGRRLLRLQLRAVAPWTDGQITSNIGGVDSCMYAVEISVSKGLVVTPQQASLHVPVNVTISIAEECRGGDGDGASIGHGDEPFILTVSGRDVLTMRRQVIIP